MRNEKNALMNRKDYQDIEVILNSSPTMYAIDLTNICNLRCPLCVTGLRKQTKPTKFMDFDLFREIIEKIKDYAELVQLYKWGESLLHKEFIRIIKYCNRYDLNTELSSNLALTDVDDKLEAMVRHRLKRLIVSFDGVTQEDYSRYRIGGEIQVVIDNIGKIKKFKEKSNSPFPRISLQFLKNKYMKNQIEVMDREFRNWGADDYYIENMTTLFKDRDIQKAKEWFDEEEIRQRQYLDIDTSMHNKVCWFLYEMMVIEQDGTIPSCCFATDPKDDYSKWDNKKTIIEMYNSHRFTESRKMFKNKSKNGEMTCNDCCVFMTYIDQGVNNRKGTIMINSSESSVHKEQPYISIVIPAYNRAHMIGITLESFIKQNYPKDRFEIIVSDNNSTDETGNVVKEWIKKSDVRIKYIFEKRQGVHFARNTAALSAEGEILYYTDDDMIADPDLLKELAKIFVEHPEVGSATGKVLPKWEVPPPDWILNLCNNYLLSLNDLGDETKITDHDLGVFSCHQAMRRDAFFNSGGFNPENTAGEWIGDGETGLNQKIMEMGYKFAYTGKSIIYHMIPKERMTQEYLNKRLANQGNCDSYSDYRKFKPDRNMLINTITQLGGKFLETLNNYVQNYYYDNIIWHMDRANMEYFLSRIDYNFRLIEDQDFRTMVLNDNWLEIDKAQSTEISQEAKEIPDSKTDINGKIQNQVTKNPEDDVSKTAAQLLITSDNISDCREKAINLYISMNFPKAHLYAMRFSELTAGNNVNITEKILIDRRDILLETGEKLVMQKDFVKALRIFNEAMHTHPEVFGLHFARGFCLAHLDRKEEAIDALKSELKIASDNQQAIALLKQLGGN